MYEAYPLYVKRQVLEMLDLEENEENLEMVDTMLPSEVFEHVLHYDGLLGTYPSKIKKWVFDIYGIDLCD